MSVRDLLLLPAFLVGAAVPNPEPAEDRLSAHMTVLGVTLEETTFEDAQQLLGETEVRHDGGDGHASAYGACYVGPDGTTLALVSHAEMGGGTTLTDLQLLAAGAEPDFSGDEGYVVPPEQRPRCTGLAKLSRATATSGGLHVGMTREEVLGRLGEPAESGEDHLVFTAEAAVPMSPEWTDPYTRNRWLRVEFTEGKVTAIRAMQVTFS